MLSFWISVGVIFSVLEILTPSFFFLWFGIGGFVAAVASFFVNVVFQVVIFAVVSLVLLILTRPLAKKITGGEPPRKINVEDVIGKIAVVVEKIDNNKGQGLVKVKGDIWSAYSTDESVIEKGEKVRILKVEGAHVVVERVVE